MEEIVIQIIGEVNITITGEILEGDINTRNRGWVFHAPTTFAEEIPRSSINIGHSEMTIRTANMTITPRFWRIDEIDEDNNIFIIETFPNNIDLLSRNI